MSRWQKAVDTLSELRELGLSGTLFRLQWEARLRSGLAARHPEPRPPEGLRLRPLIAPFRAPAARYPELAARLGVERERLLHVAERAAAGHILCFSRWEGDFGSPLDWYLNPTNGKRWSTLLPWPKALSEMSRVGDVKLTWEAARFPHAFWMARAALLHPERADALASALDLQIDSFLDAAPWGQGIHWYSSQEIAFRLFSWLFASETLGAEKLPRLAARLPAALHAAACHVESHIGYAQKAVYNNHLLSEAALLYVAGLLLEACPEAERWKTLGRSILEEQAGRQFYEDGGYIQQSHTYHRVALQVMLLAGAYARAAGEEIPQSWRGALSRSHAFLSAQMGPGGRVPNYGANDGALPLVLSTGDYLDFRPTLAAVLAASEQRLPQESDESLEEAFWLVGEEVLSLAPLETPKVSASFVPSGHHVLRGSDPSTRLHLRCGTPRDRFTQMDMLHVDFWWRGHNVLADAGSYLYNGEAKWNRHFLRTESHNTIGIDGRDQMLHHRPFKVLHRAEARLLRFEDTTTRGLMAGEHHGFLRHPGRCVHRRSVLRVTDDLWVVVDRVTGTGEHELRLQWLAGEYPYVHSHSRLSLQTPSGEFCLQTFDESARALRARVAKGAEEPPRGWISRYYGEKTPVASYVVEKRSELPAFFISVLSAGPATLQPQGRGYRCETAQGSWTFDIDDGIATLQGKP